jgi:hypothetical protein
MRQAEKLDLRSLTVQATDALFFGNAANMGRTGSPSYEDAHSVQPCRYWRRT